VTDFNATSGNDSFAGTSGAVDSVNYGSAASGVSINLAVSTAQATGGSGTDTLVSIENLTGSGFDDRLAGNSDANVLNGSAGSDMLLGGGGNDTLIDGQGRNVIDGGTGTDTLSFAGSNSTVGVDLSNPGLQARFVFDNFSGNSAASIAGAQAVSLAVNAGSSFAAEFASDIDLRTPANGQGGIISGLKTGGSRFTIQFEVVLTTTSNNWAPLVDISNNGAFANRIWIGLPPNSTAFHVSIGDPAGNLFAINSLISPPTGQKLAIAVTFDNGILNLWINGSLAATGNAGLFTVADAVRTHNYVSYSPFYGTTQAQIDNLQFWSRNLSAGDISGNIIYNVENITGGNAGDTLVGDIGSNAIDGGAGNDTLSGNDNADTLTGGAGNDTLNGGTGLDTAVYSGIRADYAVSGGGALIGITDTVTSNGDEGTDTLADFEFVRFADGVVSVSQIYNRAPIITSNGGGAAAAISVAENQTAVTAVAASDADSGTTLVYSIVGGADAALFLISSSTGALSFVNGRNFEAPNDAGANNVYDVVVRVSDGTLVDDQAIAVTVTNANEFAPVITSANTASFAENGTGTAYQIVASDQDAGTALTYSLNGTDAALFNISATGAVTFKTAPNFETPADAGGNNVYNINVNASDGALTASSPVAISVTNVTEPNPAIVSNGAGPTATITMAENIKLATTVVATPPDTGPTALTYSIIGGEHATQFTINSVTGALSFVRTPDFEAPPARASNNSYRVDVQASNGITFDTQALTINITNVNEAPAILSPTAVGFADGRTGIAYSALATRDAGETLSWSLSGTDAARFNLDSATGAVTFKTAPDVLAPTDAGADNAYDIELTASDGALTTSQAVTITVLPLANFAPTITSAAAVSVPERTIGAIYKVQAVQPDGNTGFTWTIGGPDAVSFNINVSTGQVSFNTPPSFATPVDAGANNVYDITVTATKNGLSSSKAVAISVTDAPESAALINGLGGSSGFGTTSLQREDDLSLSIDIKSIFPGGLKFGANIFNSMFINTNGTVSFAAALPGWTAQPFPASSNPTIAPFWADVDTRFGAGTVSPGGTSTGSNLVWYNVDSANRTITVTWDDVQAYTGGASSVVNAFQMRIIARPQGTTSAGASFAYGADTFDIEYRYETINWTSGTVSGGLLAGVGYDFGDFVNFSNLSGSRTAAIANVDTALVAGQSAIGIVRYNNLANAPLLPTITTAALAKAEGQGGTAPFSIVVARQGDFSRSATVDWSVASIGNNPAVAADFVGGVLPSGRVTFAAGAALATITLQLVADRVLEPDETFSLVLSNPFDATILGVTATTMTILADEVTPTVTSGGTASVAENTTGIAYQAAATGSPGANFLWTLDGTDAGRFNIDAATGAVTFKTAPNFEAPADTGANNVYDITVAATDGSQTSAARAVAITVTNVNEAPVAVADGVTLDEGAVSANLASLLLGNDSAAEPGDTRRIVSVSTLGSIGGVAFDEATQSLVYTASPFNTLGQGDTGSDSFTYTIADGQGRTSTATVTLSITGLTTADVFGTPGIDTLDGRIFGAIMYGGAGNDIYNVVSTLDRVIEVRDEGFDTVRTALSSYVTPDFVDRVIFTGSGDFTGIGNAGRNILIGGAGNDWLDGSFAPDIMQGGAGDDTYIVDFATATDGDTVTEAFGEGRDTVRSSVPYVLPDNVEVLYITGTKGFAGTGNSLDNAIFGNAGNNVLAGLAGNDLLVGNAGADTLDGGTGADEMIGGTGNDIYRVDDNGDTVVELPDEGSDIVQTTLNIYSLAAIDDVENLVFTGVGSFTGTGNAFSNVITGAAGNDLLDGGIGRDMLTGGLGDDSYRVDMAGDTVIEKTGGGTDTVLATSDSFVLPSQVENLTYVGAGNFSGTGNFMANILTGGDGNDWFDAGLGDDQLFGGDGSDTLLGGNGSDRLDGGRDTDTLTGGANNDIFVLSKTGANGDTITDFAGNGASAGDRLLLTGWGAGTVWSLTAVPGQLMITDGTDATVAFVNISGAIHATDVIFG
jgi:Ca2+-binding RTX toxin-like protein